MKPMCRSCQDRIKRPDRDTVATEEKPCVLCGYATFRRVRVGDR